jgi:hypothetical protein
MVGDREVNRLFPRACIRSVAHGARVRSLRFLWFSPGGLLCGYRTGGGLDDKTRTVSLSSWINQIGMTRFS